jgi:hypothetical protein
MLPRSYVQLDCRLSIVPLPTKRFARHWLIFALKLLQFRIFPAAYFACVRGRVPVVQTLRNYLRIVGDGPVHTADINYPHVY